MIYCCLHLTNITLTFETFLDQVSLPHLSSFMSIVGVIVMLKKSKYALSKDNHGWMILTVLFAFFLLCGSFHETMSITWPKNPILSSSTSDSILIWVGGSGTSSTMSHNYYLNHRIKTQCMMAMWMRALHT